ncbi:DUF6252 family protein [Hymenobacter canadensis]|uniref:DUF6252 family protein n=1 Tax=Hymenobacter canadensis TaxID=2999067 RepID=A0ABY7LMM9_9BACT|nr:DUF6252 family protein [Hymenobacter canadensis]WBA41081.1 DUF6252 family protein [Hymenobacter canadensis]
MRKLFLYAALLLLSQCSKCKDNDPSPEAQLPPATQTGANTFGCLVNGEPFTPAGRVGLDPNLYFEYDTTFNGGTFTLQAFRAADRRQQTIILRAIPLAGLGTYSFALPNSIAQIAYSDTRLPDPCDETYSESDFAYRQGSLTITRLDPVAGIVSGTFEVKVVALGGCDTIRLTNGRFDVRR